MSNRHSIGVRYLTHKIERLKSSRDDLIESIENAENNDKNSIGTTVTVSYEGQSCNIIVLPNESILAALERQSIYVQSQLTTLPDMPSDCRRGNCMTCAALIKNNNNKSPSSRGNYDRLVIRNEDNGLSPTISKMIAEQGYVLTCSSFLRSPHHDDPAITSNSSSNVILQFELSVQTEIWNEIYDHRFTSPETETVARAAMARVLRQSAERNPQEWIQSTERILRQTEIE